MKALPPLLESRIGLYLATYDRHFNAGSIFTSFFNAVLFPSQFSCPDYVDIVVAPPYFNIVAHGSDILGRHNFSDLAFLCDIGNFDEIESFRSTNPHIPYNFYRLAPIVWLTEYCLLTLSTAQMGYKQSYLYGECLEEAVMISDESKSSPYLGFCFTLPPRIFDNSIFDIQTLRQVMSIWRKTHHPDARGSFSPAPNLELSWREQSELSYSLRIVPVGGSVSTL